MDAEQGQKQDEIVAFLWRRTSFLPPVSPFPWANSFQDPARLPTVETQAKEWADDAEFRTLQLGSWLGTTDGEVITEAVGVVIPPIYQPEYNLAIESLKLAAKLQQRHGQRVAIVWALAGACVAGLMIWGSKAT
jgi:hypothetical protein